MTYVKANVLKPSNLNAGKGGDKKNVVYIIDVADLLNEASRDSKGVLISGSHSFKENAYAIKLYCTPGTHEGKVTTEGDPDSKGLMQQYKIEHPGSELEKLEFEANWINRSVIIIEERCSDNVKFQYGASCAPLILDIEATDNKDANKSVYTFKSILKGPNKAKYEGTVSVASPVATLDADATIIDLSSGEGEYQLTDNTVPTQILSCSNEVDDLVFTVLGSGGSNPATIQAGGDFFLKNGTTWTGLANSKITFKVFKDASSNYVFFELSRV